MPDAGPIAWSPSSVLPKKPMSFAGVGYEEMMSRARALKPTLAQRAETSERLRRLPDETERDAWVLDGSTDTHGVDGIRFAAVPQALKRGAVQAGNGFAILDHPIIDQPLQFIPDDVKT